MAGSSEKDQLLHCGEWLVDMLEKHNQQTSSKPEIGKVPRALREIKSNENCFDPSVVALGPYHHDKELLKPMESYKEEAARWFVKLLACPGSANNVCSSKVREIYDKFVTKATTISPKEPVATAENNQTQTSVNSAKKNLKDWYVADESTEKFNDEDFNHMMFLDGCFILCFIDLEVNKGNGMTITSLNRAFILMDMFLLENQIPYVVLEALMKVMREEQSSNNNQKKIDIDSFICSRFLPGHASTSSSSLVSPCLGPLINCLTKKRDEKRDDKADGTNTEGILHLLDFLRIKLIGGPPKLSVRGSQDYYFRSIMELKAAGIKIHRSPSSSRHLNEIKFKKGFVYGELLLPQMSIDDTTKTWLLNLIAFEMCPQGPSSSDRTITSYICFMDSLIDQADDVKELRSKDVLLNCLGSDEEVAKLFNEVAINLVPNPRAYGDTKEAIQSHCKSRCKVWFAEMLYAHFSSPWTVLSLIAAIFLLFLTVIQTVYTVWN